MNCMQRCNCCAIFVLSSLGSPGIPLFFNSIEIISSGKPALPALLLPALTSHHLLFRPGHCLKRRPHIVAFGLYPRKPVLQGVLSQIAMKALATWYSSGCFCGPGFAWGLHAFLLLNWTHQEHR